MSIFVQTTTFSPFDGMDAFQIRLDCLALVKKVNASQQAIAKVVDFALKYASIASDDVWDCIVSECARSSLNNKLNILFLIDALLISIVDPVGYSSFSDAVDQANPTIAASHYLSLAARDLIKIIDSVVPKDDWDSVRMNATDTQKIIASWKRLGVFKNADLESAFDSLQLRKEDLAKLPSSSKTQFSKQDTLRRIEEDRERHKRLRERAWILPAKSFADAIPRGKQIQSLSSTNNRTTIKQSIDKPDAINIEFEDLWENLSDLNEDDYEKMQETDRKWWGSSTFVQKQQMVMAVTEKEDREDRKRRRESPRDIAGRDIDNPKLDERSPPNRWRKIGLNSNKPSRSNENPRDKRWNSRKSEGNYRRNRW